MIVVDTNIIAHLIINEEYFEAAKELLRKDSQWIAPYLWRSEFQNILATYLRNEYYTLEEALSLMHTAMELMRGNEYQIVSTDVLRLAADSGCSAYDCEFVALAHDLGVPLYTSDKQLIRAFPDIVIPFKK